nr:hypothetical protein RVX_0285 [Nitratidesulfovibrio sp. HK-II]
MGVGVRGALAGEMWCGDFTRRGESQCAGGREGRRGARACAKRPANENGRGASPPARRMVHVPPLRPTAS